MRKKYLILVLMLAVALLGSFAFAQIRSTDIVLSISPLNPNPNQDVSATISSHSTDLDKANISWLINNQETSKGIGKKSFSFRMGSLGTPTVLSVSIETLEGQTVSKNITITPADVDMLWEAYDTYAPPFYKGRILAPSQGQYKVVAMPNIINQNGKVDVTNLSYDWKKDDDNQIDSSGWGKNYFIFQNSYLDKNNVVEVAVSDISGGTNASGKINLQPIDPKILFYENDPTLGTKWETSLSDGFSIDSNGKTIVAEPYFFSPKNINSGDLDFGWSLNGNKIDAPNPKNILSVKPEAGQSGDATISLDINNINTLFQEMAKQITVSF